MEIDSMTKLLRFLYLGQCNGQYKAKAKITTNVSFLVSDQLDCINAMAQGMYDLPLSVIKKVNSFLRKHPLLKIYHSKTFLRSRC